MCLCGVKCEGKPQTPITAGGHSQTTFTGMGGMEGSSNVNITK